MSALNHLFHFVGFMTCLLMLLISCYFIWVLVISPIDRYMYRYLVYSLIMETIKTPYHLYRTRNLTKRQAQFLLEGFDFKGIWVHRFIKRKCKKITNE